MTTNKVCGKGKCKFTDEFCMSGDCPYDTENMLKNQQNFNTSEGNVKENNTFSNQKREEHNTFCKENVANNVAQRNSQDKELMKKIFPHKEIIEGESVLVFPYIEEATPLKDVPQEVVSHMEKTIDHISQEGKKVSLTELWKKGELEEGYYYLKGNKYIFIGYFNGVSFEETCDFEIKEVLAEVPNYIEWKNYVNGYCDEHEYNLELHEENERLKKWVEEFNALDVAEENLQLKELLKECRDYIQFRGGNTRTTNQQEMLDKIDEVLK